MSCDPNDAAYAIIPTTGEALLRRLEQLYEDVSTRITKQRRVLRKRMRTEIWWMVTRNSVPHRHFRRREQAILYVTDPDFREFVELRRWPNRTSPIFKEFDCKGGPSAPARRAPRPKKEPRPS